MSAVRPEFGPTLPELLRPLPRAARAALATVAVLVLAAIVWLVVKPGNVRTVAVDQPVGFRFDYLPPLQQRTPHPGELARVAGHGQSFAVRRLRLPAYRGDVAGFLPLHATQLEREMARTYPGFRLRAEGRANINRIQGYEILFRFHGPGGRKMLARRELLLPTATAREGVDLLLVARRSGALKNPGDVGGSGSLKRALRSFVLAGADQS